MLEATNVIEPNTYARIRLYGRKVKNRDIARELAKKMTDRQNPLTQTQAGGQLGIKSPDSIRKFVSLGKQLNYFGGQEMANAKQLMSVKELFSDDLVKHPLVRAWIDDMQVKKDGKPLKGIKPLVRGIIVFCRTLKIDPQMLLIGSDNKDKRDNVAKYIKQYIELYLSGNAAVNYRDDPNKRDKNNIRLRVVMPLRNFLSFHGINFPPRMGGIWSASVELQQGKYSDIRITNEMYLKCQEYLIKNYGMDSEILRVWCIGIEGLARQSALMQTPKKIEVMKNDDKTIYTHKVYESKQEMEFPKYYHTPVCRKAIDKRQKSKSPYMFDTRSRYNWTEHTEILKDMYRKFDLTVDGRLDPDDPETAYCIRKPTHTLRHYGAQRWLLLTDWNKDVVYPMGWKSSVELTKSYGEPPAHIRAKLLWQANLF